MSSYIKSITSDFPNGKVNPSGLKTEIGNSTIVTALERIDIDGDSCVIVFKASLSTGDQTTLDNVVSQHNGEVKNEPMTVKVIESNSTDLSNNFHTSCHIITANAGTTNSIDFSYPYDTAPLQLRFTSVTGMENDDIDLALGPDTVIGITTSNLAVPTTWTSQNYVIGDRVTYNDPNFGNRVYTCILNTVASELPTDKIYWRHGYEIPVDSTVIDNTNVGYCLSIGSDVLDRVLHKGVDKVYTETAPSTTYVSGSAVKQTAYQFKGYRLGPASTHVVGNSKIGGTDLPADVKVRLTYHNNGTVTQTLVGYCEYLY